MYVANVYLSETTFVDPVDSSQTVVLSQPVVYSEKVIDSRPVRVYRSETSSLRVIREEAPCQSESLGAKRLEAEPKVTFSESNGHRVKTYRYE